MKRSGLRLSRSEKQSATISTDQIKRLGVESHSNGWKDTRRALGAAHHVDAGGHHVWGLSAAGQLLGQRHLVEVEGRVQAALAHLQLVAQRVDGLLGCEEGRQEKGKKTQVYLVQEITT